ncbi:MAG: DNA polymerase III subunit gamma/tau, partial [Bdellovibrionaceae bacterium]|nr:DNA polymerase III subunit gamma/tau [Pseudobdellovibrionaceae bacterium]
IANSRHIDVIEIDGASNNGVDAVRELRDSVGYSPSSGKYKVYIIDEVHMLSTSAFNALLKTLEEPPAHVVFILATTEVQKIPNTILSRCQRYDFRMISQQDIMQHLTHVCTNENVRFDKEALWLIARQAKGSMRDAQSLLDQIITYANGHITVASVTEQLGLVQRVLINSCLKSILDQDIAALSRVVADLSLAGADPMLFVEALLEQFRNLLMVKIQAQTHHVPIPIPESELELLQEWSKQVSEEDIHLLFDITLKGSQVLVRAAEPRLALEMLLLKLGSAPKIVSLSQLIENTNSTQSHATVSQPQKAKPATSPITSTERISIKPRASVSETPPEEVSLEQTLHNISDPWLKFVEMVRSSNGFLAALIEHTYIIEESATALRLGLPEKMAFLHDKVSDPKNLERLTAFIHNFWKKELQVSVEMVQSKPTTTMTPKEKAQHSEQEKRNKEREDIENHPMIQKANSLFKTEIRSIKQEKT